MATEKWLIDAKAFHYRVSQHSMTELLPNWKELPKEVQDMLCKHGQHLEILLETQPTVDAVEVVHGRWIHSKSMVLSAKCSVCEGWVTKHSVNESDFNYCPNCGAKMDGDENDKGDNLLRPLR